LLPGDPAHDLAGALHEVSNALTVVLGWIERARDGRSGTADIERALEVAADRASLARSIVRRAIGAEALAEPAAAVSIVVGDAIVGMEPELARADIRAEARVAAAVVDRAVDHAPTVLQILTNLLLNAVAMSPSGSTVQIEAVPAASGTAVIFAVSDEGPGVPPERRPTLFDAGLTTRAGGAGIGLRHAAALARSLGGALALGESPAGARFELTWPLLPSSSQPITVDGAFFSMSERGHGPAGLAMEGAETSYISTPTTFSPPPPPSSLPLAGTRILLVEDDDAVVDLLDVALTARGADVVSIRHHRELQGALATGPFDAALFDISPIKDDVRGAVAVAREASEALRVVLISGSTAELPALPDEWVAAWVRKPFEVGEIVAALTQKS